MTKRECGDCSACCEWYDIEILDKPRGQKCQHSGCTGCDIYDSAEKPTVCSEFSCLWLDDTGELTESERPDKIGVIFQHRETFRSPDRRAYGFDYAYVISWDPQKDPKELGSSMRKVVERLAKVCPIILPEETRVFGPWDEDGNLLPTARRLKEPIES